MSFQPRAGISDGVSANRPRRESRAPMATSVSGVANRRGRKPRTSNAAVSAVAQIGMRSIDRSALAMPLCGFRFGGLGAFRESGRRRHVFLRGVRYVGRGGCALCLGFFLHIAIGILRGRLGLLIGVLGRRLGLLVGVLGGLSGLLVSVFGDAARPLVLLLRESLRPSFQLVARLAH